MKTVVKSETTYVNGKPVCGKITKSIENSNNYKIGDVIKHYCCGVIVNGEVIEVNKYWLRTKHESIRWGDDYYNQSTLVWNGVRFVGLVK